jgi:hypothetical protein
LRKIGATLVSCVHGLALAKWTKYYIESA